MPSLQIRSKRYHSLSSKTKEGKRRSSPEEVFRKPKTTPHNLPFIKALAQMPKYAKFLKGLLTNKARLEEACTITMNERCSTVLLNKLPSKEKDPGSFTIPCDIGQLHINNALADLWASISLMPYKMYEKLRLGEPKDTIMRLELTNRSIQYPRGIIEIVLIKVDKFVLPIDFVILDMPEDSRVPIIIGRPFLATTRAMIDVFNKKITLRVGDDEVIFDVNQSIKRPPTEDDECYRIDDLDDTINGEAQELLANDEADSFLSRGLEKSIDQSDLEDCGHVECNNNNDSNKPVRRIMSSNTPYSDVQETVEPVKLEREHLYSASANEIDEKKPELKDLPNHLEYAYLHGDKSFPIIISFELFDREKSLLFQVLEKRKGAIAWKMSDIKGIRFFQIPIALEDQEKTTFTYLYGTFTYRRMPFGLCNAPATFQICMTAIFHDMVEDFMEVFMDDFTVFGNSFDCCLANIDRMLARCEETNLVLNWEKCHFMVKEGIVSGHKISGAGIEVDRAKIDVIAKLPYPTNVKGVRSFLGHAEFYRRFIKDFSLISKPMIKLLMKDAKFDFSNDCKKSFNILKEKLTTAPIIISPDWNVPFELICDASDFVFHPYLVLSKIIVYTDHSALKYLFSKQDAKPRLIRWVLLRQGFDIEIKDKRGAENLATDHLSRLKNPELSAFTEEEIADAFPDEYLMALKTKINNDEPTAYKTPTGCTHFRLVYRKACHLPVKIKHKAYWVLKQCNMDLTAATKNRFMKLNELMELRDSAYENTRIYKERTKKWHDSGLQGDKNFKVGDIVLLFNSRFKMHLGKLKSKWYGPNVVKTVYPYGTIKITDINGVSFKVNGQRLKKYHERHIDAEDVIEFEEDTT
ncbi:reverse transcriptase domain-containing protein [Tanacetum coccineum]|uniref:RNA-directed DNA polymerase n=1 Tax=Tanacetum coccineum TaxID=301880 RepID=A0ABQ4YIK6_9ASTR